MCGGDGVRRTFTRSAHLNYIRKLVIAFAIVFGFAQVDAQDVTIDANTVHQRITGFGASCAFREDEVVSKNLVDFFFKPNFPGGIALSILRVRVPSTGTGTTSDRIPAAENLMRLAEARGVMCWASCWSPPSYMKSNGSSSNGGSLLATSYQAYAEYLANYVLQQKALGITISAISIQNEPN